MATTEMKSYRKKSTGDVLVCRWNKNGDHPEDYVGDDVVPQGDGMIVITAEERRENDWEGAVVRRWRNGAINDNDVCMLCSHIFEQHGWIDSTMSDHAQGVMVCPGDYVLKDANGKYNAVSPKLFERVYEEVPSKDLY